MESADGLKSLQKVIEVKVLEKHVPNEFFQDRKGLWVGSGFENNIRDKAEPTEVGTEFKVSSFELVEDLNDEQIEKLLPEKHLLSESEVCAIIAGLIEKQPKGEDGVLLNTGYANLFYTPSRVVRVHWHGGGWDVGVWDRGGGTWLAGSRVFSPATEI